MSEQLKVHAAIGAIMREIATTGIAKARRNAQQGYDFRGIDDVLNALAPLMSKHGIFSIPRILTRTVTERLNAKGTALFYVVLEAEFDFVSALDGSRLTVRMFGEAMDSGDKATGKAVSMAYKSAVILLFQIPTEGNNDTEGDSHEVFAEADATQVAKLNACATMEQLQAFWKSLQPGDRKLLEREKNRRKGEIEAEQAEAA
jgi:hypothetical protein